MLQVGHVVLLLLAGLACLPTLVVGNMLNAHYFPGVNFYNGGRYKEAEEQFRYVIARPQYLEQNAKRPELMSTAHYLRGMIYLYHAKGLGRQMLAKSDFENALKWNSRNYTVYLELSRLYGGLGFREQAISIVQHLLNLAPEEKIAEEARNELSKLKQSANDK